MDENKTTPGAGEATNPTQGGAGTPAANPAAGGEQQTNPTSTGNPGGGTTLAGDAGKPAENKDPAAPITYDFKESAEQFKDAFDWKDEDNQKFVELIKDMKLSNEQANNILKYGMTWGKGIITSIADKIIAERQSWGDEAVAQMGSGKDTTLHLVATALNHIEKTIPGVREALNETGAGNRIELIRAFEMMGKMLQSDPGKAAAVGGAGAAPKDIIAEMYPNTDFGKYE